MKKYFFIFLLIVLVFIGCESEDSKTAKHEIPSQEKDILLEENADERNKEYIIDEEADKWFEEVYAITSLDKHEVYKVEDEININLYFHEEVTRKEIRKSREFIMRVFILQQSSPIGAALPYQQILYGDLDWNKVNFRLYIGGKKVLEENFDQIDSGNIKIDYYENMDIELPSRLIENEYIKDFAKKIQRRYWSVAKVVFEKSYKGNVLVVKLKGSKVYKEKDINKIKKMIKDELAPKLENESKKIYGTNVDYLGVVLQLYANGKKYYEETYNNGKEKKWFYEDWMNYKYFLKSYAN